MSGQNDPVNITSKPARIIPADAIASFLQHIKALKKFISLCWCLYIMNATLVLPINDNNPTKEIIPPVSCDIPITPRYT